MKIYNNLQNNSNSCTFKARLPKMSKPEKNILEKEMRPYIKHQVEHYSSSFVPQKVIMTAIDATILGGTVYAIAQHDLGLGILTLVCLKMSSTKFIHEAAVKEASMLAQKLKFANQYTDAQRLVIVDKYLQKTGDYIYTPFTRLFNKQKIMSIAKVDPNILYNRGKILNETDISPDILKAYDKIGWSKRETIKFINELNACDNLSDSNIIEIAKELYNSTTHLERPLSNKIKAKIFREITEPHSEEFNELA